MEEWLTTYEAARLSGFNPEYVRELLRQNKILGRKWGQSWQVNWPSLQEYLKTAEQLGSRRGAKKRPNPKNR